MTLKSLDIVNQLFTIGYTTGHFLLEPMTRYYFDANIGFVFIEEVLEFYHVYDT